MKNKNTHLQAMQDIGWYFTSTGERLSGERLGYLRTGTALDIYRQRDGATKHEDLGEEHPSLPEDTPQANRAWAMRLAADELTDWRPEEGGYCPLCSVEHAAPRPADAPKRPRGRPRREEER